MTDRQQSAALEDDPDQALEGMVYVPAGPFLMGTAADEVARLLAEVKTWERDLVQSETPQHEVRLAGYYVGQYPVTNAEYQAFMTAGGYQDPAYWTEAIAAGHWEHGQLGDYDYMDPRTQPTCWDIAICNAPRQPVVGVTWYEAVAYCRWAGGRLPTEAEWEKAAGWDPAAGRKRRYPWGDRWEPDRGNWGGKVGHPTAVGEYPGDESAYAVREQAGNVYEWCSTRWRDEQGTVYTYPYDLQDRRENLAGGDGVWRVMRGASWAGDEDDARTWTRCTRRGGVDPKYRASNVGFRLVVPRRLLSPDPDS